MIAPKIIKHYGRAMEAVDLGGQKIYRKDRIFLKSYQRELPVLNTEMHFCYKTHRFGVSTMCTCGSMASIFSYQNYKHYHSKFIGMEVIACHSLITTGRHSDGTNG